MFLTRISCIPALGSNIFVRSTVTPRHIVKRSFATSSPCLHGFPGQVSNNSSSEVRFRDVSKSLKYYIWPKDNPQLRKRVVLSGVFLVLAKVSNVLVPYIMKLIIDSLSEVTKLQDLDQDEMLLVYPASMIVAFGVMRICAMGFNELKNALFANVAQENIKKTSLEAFEHIHGLDLSFHLNRKTGMLAKVLDRGARSISFILSTLVFNWIPTLIEIGLVCGIMAFKFGTPFAATALSCVVIYSIFTLLVTRWRIKYRILMNNMDNELGSRTIDSLINYETVKYFNNEKHESDRINRVLTEYEKASLKTSNSLAALNFGQGAIFSLSLLWLMMLCSSKIILGTMSVGDLVMLNGLLFQLSVPLYFLGSLYRDIREALANLGNLYQVFSKRSKIVEVKDAEQLFINTIENEKEFIKFENISFGYNDKVKVLDNVNISIPYMNKVAIVGGSGSGKSTLLRLLYRFYDPQSGTITINGKNIQQYSLVSLRKAISVVPQDQVMFHESLFYNIQYGNINATREQVLKAANVSGLQNVVSNFVDGYDSQIGERGLKLSGGEKQRVAIARAILKDAPILFYDEATSSLDAITEKSILYSIRNFTKKKTSIFVAHRLSTVVDADIIYVLDSGRVVNTGTHHQLLTDPTSLYAELWRKQNEINSNTKVRDTENFESQRDVMLLMDEACGMSDKCCKK